MSSSCSFPSGNVIASPDETPGLPDRQTNRRTLRYPLAAYEAALRHMRAGQYLDAQLCCEQALALDPGHADTLHMMGLLSLQAEQFDHAVEWIARALKQIPKPEYLYSLGTALRGVGRLDDALKAFDKAVQLKPDKAELWIAMGRALGALDRPADALLSFQHALALNPRSWDAAAGNRRSTWRARPAGRSACLFQTVPGVAAGSSSDIDEPHPLPVQSQAA